MWVGAWRFIRDRFLEKMVKKAIQHMQLNWKKRRVSKPSQENSDDCNSKVPFFQTLKSYRKRGITQLFTQAEKLSPGWAS